MNIKAAAVLTVLVMFFSLPLKFMKASNLGYFTDENGVNYAILLHEASVVSSPDAFGNIVILSDIDGRPVERIWWGAFENNTNIESIVISDGIGFIDEAVFVGCTNFERIDFPNSVYYIGQAFSNCSNLKEINVSADNEHYTSENGVLYNKDKTELIAYPEGKTDFSYTLPENLERIPETPWGWSLLCPYLKEINVPDNSEYFASDNGVLYNKNKTELIMYPIGKESESFTVPNGVKTIRLGAFEIHSKFTTITIPPSVTAIGTLGTWWDENGNIQKANNLTIQGYKDTAAETYAFENGFKFIDLDGEPEVILGDLTGEGKPTMASVIILAKYLATPEPNALSEPQKKAADINGDGVITLFDLTLLVQLAAIEN